MRLSPAVAPLIIAAVFLPYACGGGKASSDAAAGGDGSISVSGAAGSAGGSGGGVGGSGAGSAGNAGAGNRAGTAGGGTSGTGNTAGSRACGGTTGTAGAGGGCECPRNFIACGGLCVQSNDSHCGDCTTTCSGTKACSDGRCHTKCPTGTECAVDEVCVLELCEARCQAGEVVCPDGFCANVNGGDPLHCGNCDTVCPSGTLCNAGRCS